MELKISQTLLYLLSFLFFWSSCVAAAPSLPVAVILPLQTLGIDQKSIQKSLSEYLRAKLSRNYHLKSETELHVAMEAV